MAQQVQFNKFKWFIGAVIAFLIAIFCFWMICEALLRSELADKNWFVYESKEDNFSILIPNTPKMEEHKIKTPLILGKESDYATLRTFTSNTGLRQWKQKDFSVMHLEFTDAPVDKSETVKGLDLFEKTLTSKFPTLEILEKKDIYHEKYPGREILCRWERMRRLRFLGIFPADRKYKALGLMRIFTVDNKSYYQVLFTYLPPHVIFNAKLNYDEAHRFLDSFQINI